jgi:hypothetical protein
LAEERAGFCQVVTTVDESECSHGIFHTKLLLESLCGILMV